MLKKERKRKGFFDMKKKLCAGCRKTSCDGCQLKQYQKLHTNKSAVLTDVMGNAERKEEGLGLVFDVGTTTVAGYLWDLQTGKCLCAQSCENPQRAAGSDVVSRLSFCMDEKGVFQEARQRMLQQMMVQTLDEVAGELLASAEGGGEGTEELLASAEGGGEGIEELLASEELREGVKRVVIVGNTVMCSILAGKSLEGLTRAPFHKPYEGYIREKGAAFGFSGLSQAEVIILPAIESFVGADALAVYRYVKEKDDRRNLLLVDIGTNGEIILVGKEVVYACSAAAGPALEGAAAAQGMCATKGAVEAVNMTGNFPREDISCKVIGGGRAEGICGSGLVDALALCHKMGVVDESGYLRSRAEARKAGVREKLCQRIAEEKGERKFLLTGADAPVYLTAEDIRQLQLAKGAVLAAIRLLLEKEGITADEITRIYLAGAFGSYINPENAMAIGLLPKAAKEKVTAIGNGAALGGALALFSEEEVKEAQQDAVRIKHVEAAKEPLFEAYFMEGISLP